LIDEKKVAGILLESKLAGNFCDFAIIGIGINVTSNPSQTMFPASNLKDFGIEISSTELLKKFLDEFEKILQNWLDFGFSKNGGSTRKLWLEKAYLLHQKISVVPDAKKPKEILSGIFEDLDDEGTLLIKAAGEIHKIHSADLIRNLR
jgi:BirA family biotin operon repressor/biotin-[acetyl-CoA-carboxylase] ligase